MSMRGSEFLLVPWQRDFIEALLDTALDDLGGDISNALFIFPNSRPEKYLSRLLRQDSRIARPLIMPRMTTVSTLFSDLRSRILARPAWNAGLLDRVGLLLQCVRENNSSGRDGEKAFAFLDDAGQFLPWGLRLASLFEECLSQLRTPANFHHAEGIVSPFAAALLARLGNIFQSYISGLEEREWTTAGLDATVTANHLEKQARLPEGLVDEVTIYIAGFHTLTRAEKTLFHHLWQQGARIVLHGDAHLAATGRAAFAGERKAHWSCTALREWADEWKTDIIPASLLPIEAKKTHSVFYQGFDLHSQLRVLESELADDVPPPAEPDGETGPASLEARQGLQSATETDGSAPPPGTKTDNPGEENEQQERDQRGDTVIVLPDSGLLMPVLHHLPRTDINISMGYPLSRSPLFHLLDTIATLQEHRRGKSYYWRDLLDLIRHPYLKMLRPPVENGGSNPDAQSPINPNAPDDDNGRGEAEERDAAPLRRELHRLEHLLRGQGQKFIEPLPLLEEMYQTMDREDLPPAPVLGLLQRMFSLCLDGFEHPVRPAELGSALGDLCTMLLECGAHLWERFLIDAECLFRIMQSLIPELARSVLAQERFPRKTLYGVLRRLMQAERVPFEASPLVGLQVMGMLETRLLTFRRVIILDAGEDRLPGSPAGDPLLPEALRPELGLPLLGGREQVAAYHFFRLLAGADEVRLLWEEGSDTPGIQEQKKKKSRFVEELLWEEEKRLGHILSPDDTGSPLRHLAANVSPVPRSSPGISVTNAVADRMAQVLAGPVSASLLDCYLRCPVNFHYKYLAKLNRMEEVNEDNDPLAVGLLFHEILQEGYKPLLGRELPGGAELAAMIGEDLEAALLSSAAFARLTATLPADSAIMLRRAGKARLVEYLNKQPPTTVLSLERDIVAPFEFMNRTFSLYGKTDRIDLRPLRAGDDEPAPGVVVLDYKTGKLPEIKPTLWQNDFLWMRMEEWLPGKEKDDNALLHELAGIMESIQLPFYLLLCNRDDSLSLAKTAELCNAAWVELAAGGEEKMLFGKKNPQFQCWDFVAEHGPVLLNFLLRHMLLSTHAAPRSGPHCRWCFSAKLCIHGRE